MADGGGVAGWLVQGPTAQTHSRRLGHALFADLPILGLLFIADDVNFWIFYFYFFRKKGMYE